MRSLPLKKKKSKALIYQSKLEGNERDTFHQINISYNFFALHFLKRKV